MNDDDIAAVAAILARWNPLGEGASQVPDLDGYRIEAIDVLSELEIRGRKASLERLIMEVLNQAFELGLEQQDCVEPAREIAGILGTRVPR
jgi:hypothetical protein